MNNGFFSVNGLWIPGSILLFPHRSYMWGVTDAHDIKEHTLDFMKVVKPKPSN
jgi:NADH dehydrogenase [ubiquinone] 1 alpha subcomplex assembly factor 3